jgi:hypothetical protein
VIEGSRAIRDLHEWPRRSGTANSLATLFDGSDAGDWYLAERFELALELRPHPNFRARYALRRESTASVASRFTALNGTRSPNPALGNGERWVLSGSVSTMDATGRGIRLSSESSGSAELGGWHRIAAEAAGGLPGGVEWRLRGGIGNATLPPHRGFLAGGAGSVPGTVPGSIGGRRLILVELSRPWSIGLPSPIDARLGGERLNSRVSPFVTVAAAGGRIEGLPGAEEGTVHATLGGRLDLWGPILRVELGWEPRTGVVTVGVDAHPDWWPVL